MNAKVAEKRKSKRAAMGSGQSFRSIGQSEEKRGFYLEENGELAKAVRIGEADFAHGKVVSHEEVCKWVLGLDDTNER